MRKLKFLPLLFVMLLAFSTTSMATMNSASEIENDANDALKLFYKEVKGSKKYLDHAKAYLVFPDITEAGFFVGGKYGEGVLRVGNSSKAYYSITAASMGFQMGAQIYTMVIAFTSDAALNKFLLDDDEWETDVDGKIAVAEWNSKEELDDVDYDDDMVAFVFDSKGMMGSFTMEGTKFERIRP
jgi:lipid-binding SYLF domain-containing protein